MPLSRKQVKEALKTVPIDQILGVPGELTHKQREFAREVANGATKAEAYRRAYKKNASKHTLASKPYHLAADERIKAEIEAYRLASEAAAYRTPQQLRDLVIHSLTQVIIDPETNAAQRIQAAKVLGTVTEVAAFTERREVTVNRSSAEAKRLLVDKLRALITAGATDVQARDVDTLERELGDVLTVNTPADQDALTVNTPSVQEVLTVNRQGAEDGPEVLTGNARDAGEVLTVNAPDAGDGAKVLTVNASAPEVLTGNTDPQGACDAGAAAEADPTPQDAVWSPTAPMHSIPRARLFAETTPPDEVGDLERELDMGRPPGSDVGK